LCEARHFAAAEVERGERGEAAHCAQRLVCHTVAAAEEKGLECGEAAHCLFPSPFSSLLLLYHCLQALTRHAGAAAEVEGGERGEATHCEQPLARQGVAAVEVEPVRLLSASTSLSVTAGQLLRWREVSVVSLLKSSFHMPPR
jgi:hypothetical protein